MPLPSPRQRESRMSFMARTIKKLVDEGRPQKQAVAIAYNQARRHGYKVGKRKKA